MLLGQGEVTPRARAVAAAAARTPPPQAPPPMLVAGERIELQWGDEYFAGTFTSSRVDRDTGCRLHRILYDEAVTPRGRWPAQAKWHDLAGEEWRRL